MYMYFHVHRVLYGYAPVSEQPALNRPAEELPQVRPLPSPLRCEPGTDSF